LWPQTERIKAWVALAQLAHDRGDATALAQALQAATAAMGGLRAYLHHPVAGAWQEVWRADGSWQPEPVRASSLYHIVCAL
ncbi:AGE family epimerase/isomerase, partial [Acinetobacter baumannii]